MLIYAKYLQEIADDNNTCDSVAADAQINLVFSDGAKVNSKNSFHLNNLFISHVV